MELFKAEDAAITSRVEEWLSHPDFELEATFKGGEVDFTTFMAVAQRLRAKGFTALPQEDHLTISTPEHIRFTLFSFSTIQAYCNDDILAGRAFTAMIKNRATAESQVDLEDYETRIKVRRETLLAPDDAKVKEILSTWSSQRKAFRMIRRWSFESDGVRIDMSILRSSRRDRAGNFRWQTKFRDQDIMRAQPTYEIEVELLRLEGDDVAAAKKRLIRGVGEVLRGIQKNSVLIRNTMRGRVLAGYKELTGTDLFRGPALRTLRRVNFTKERQAKIPNIRDGYNVTDKADGLRVLGFVDSKGDLYLIDMSMNIYRTGLRRPELRMSLVDGEWVTQTADQPPKPTQLLLLFDIFYAPDKRPVSQFPFQSGAVAAAVAEPGGAVGAPPTPQPPENSRHFQLKAWAERWNKDAGPDVVVPGLNAETKLRVAMKEFQFGRPGSDTIFRLAGRMLNAARPYNTDGLIFTPNASPLPRKPASTFHEQFKWKPAKDNTIDFLVVTEKESGSKTIDKVVDGDIKPDTGETISSKTLKLFVGGSAENPRDIILNKKELPKLDYEEDRHGGSRGQYRPIVFTPKEFPDPKAAICKLEVHTDPDTGERYVRTEHTGEPIQSNTIVEMAYDPARPEEWRWIPLRVRADKTERFQRREFRRTMNGEATAEDVWESIYDPITISMISTGAEEPLPSEIANLGAEAAERATMARRYYERPVLAKDQNMAKELKKFHTRWIKEQILYRTGLMGGETKTLLDLACGVAGDLHVWRRVGAKFVFGLDNASKNIFGTEDGAYARYMNTAQREGGLDQITPMLFAVADSSRPLVSGAAGKTAQEADIMRSVFGRMKPTAPETLPAFVKEVGEGRLRSGADCVACMFALHYFFETPEKLEGLLRNIADTLKVGGYFIGCCFDGDKVFSALRGLRQGESKTGTEKGSMLWKITRQYEEEDLPTGDAGFGLAVDIQFATIGMEHREYLVPFRLLEEKLRLVGCELLTDKELKEVGMVNSTATFDVSWDMAARLGRKFEMSEAAKEFSFLNRWFIFRRKRADTMATAAVAAAEAAMTAATNLQVPNTLAAANGRAAAAVAAVRKTGEEAAATGAAAAPRATGAEIQEAIQTVAATAPKTYRPEDIFLFYQDAAVKDSLKIKDAGAARWLAPGAPFPIQDPDDDTIQYPSVEHFLGGMRVKLASNRTAAGAAVAGGLAASIFGREGSIHQKFLNDRLVESEGGKTPLSEKRDTELLKAEMAAVKEMARPTAMKRKGVVIDEAAWAAKKDAMLEAALKQRWTRDARFRKILEAVRTQNKTPLYYTPGSSTNTAGGVLRKADGRIEGENKMGQIMMELAGFPV